MDSSLFALVDWPSAPLTDSLVRKSLDNVLPSVVSVTSTPTTFVTSKDGKMLQWAAYDSIDHEITHSQSDRVLSSTYTIRKALIRKHFLSRCIQSYTTKRTDSLLKHSTPRTWDLEIAYADELDEMWSDELYDLGTELDDPTSWWILKPGMADRGMGIRLFNSKESLLQIFEEFEENSDDEEDENETAVITSQLRHFVIQEYISSPLLMDPYEVKLDPDSFTKTTETLQGYKFHMRAYFVASGALTLYMYPRILALFSAVPYSPPTQLVTSDGQYTNVDLAPHLTNTSLQTHRGEDGVRLLDELIGCHVLSGATGQHVVLTSEDVTDLKDQMASILAETFKAALDNPVHFQVSILPT
ncbi:hypothetical protein HWV62_27929 [Athelia sp. TMB]|nr:hypothetical protein HWV62_27929 [Athelia sp. TMB]